MQSLTQSIIIDMLTERGHTNPELGAERVAEVFQYDSALVLEQYMFGNVGQKAPGVYSIEEWFKDGNVKRALAGDARDAARWWANYGNFTTRLNKDQHRGVVIEAKSILNRIGRATGMNPMNDFRDLRDLYERIFGAGSSKRAGHFMIALGFGETLKTAGLFGLRVPEL